MTFKIWCTKAIHIRTFFLCRSLGGLAERNGLRPFLVVEGDKHFVIVQVDCVDKSVNQCLTLFLLRKVQLAEPGQPEPHKVLAELGLCKPLFGDLGFQLFLLRFQGFQSFFGGTSQNTSLNGVEHILDASFCVPKLLLIEWQVGIFFVLQLHYTGNNGINHGIVHNKSLGFCNHQIFQPLLADGFLLAGLSLFNCCTFIVPVHIPGTAGTTLPKHQGTAVTAEQFGSQKIVILCLAPGRGLFIFGHLDLHILE